MDYQEAREYISHIQKEQGREYTLDKVRELCERVGRPDRQLRIIHIAGTNGKGSVGAYISNCLAMSGYSVGRYLSPALFSYREIIQHVTGGAFGPEAEMISCEETAHCLSRLRQEIEGMTAEGHGHPTAFEIETVMAFLQFAAWHVDVAVVETGLGGRLDATNFIEKPVLTVFTDISIDHRNVLGDTLEQIAAEKFGIMKAGIPVVSIRQEESVMEMLRGICQRRGRRLRIAEPEQVIQQDLSLSGTEFSYKGQRYHLGQLGAYQVRNAIVALEAMQELLPLGFHKVNSSSIGIALSQTRWPGRFEVVSRSPFLLLDGAHNPAGARWLKKSLEIYFPMERFTCIVGVLQDKDYREILKIMLPLANKVYTITPPGERGLDSEKLAEAVRELRGRREIPVTCCPTIGIALSRLGSTGGREKILVFGSLSFLGEVYSYFDTARYI